jgi:hypothetical protein
MLAIEVSRIKAVTTTDIFICLKYRFLVAKPDGVIADERATFRIFEKNKTDKHLNYVAYTDILCPRLKREKKDKNWWRSNEIASY